MIVNGAGQLTDDDDNGINLRFKEIMNWDSGQQFINLILQVKIFSEQHEKFVWVNVPTKQELKNGHIVHVDED